MRHPFFRRLLPLLLCVALSHPAQAAGRLESLLGRLASTTTDLIGSVTAPLDGLLLGVAQLAPAGIGHVLIQLQGHNLVLAGGTAAFDARFEQDGRMRRFVVIRPEPIVAGAPVLLMFHGNGGTAEQQANLSEVADLVASEGVWAVLPEALDGSWDDDPAYPRGIDDVGFVGAVLDRLLAEFPLDPERIYAAGVSNGSFLASRLACEMSGRIAGFGIVAGTITGGLARACAPSQPRPIMLVAGTADPLVPYYGGRLGLRSAPEAYAFWLERHGCDAAATRSTAMPDLQDDGTTVDLQWNTACTSGKEVRLYTVNNGGHAWPGGWSYLVVPLVGTTSRDLQATREIWEFLQDQRR